VFIDGCRVYDYRYPNHCAECQPGFMLIEYECEPKPQNCDVSDKTEHCLSCLPGYTLFRGNCYTQAI
jgi:hypothetical protein